MPDDKQNIKVGDTIKIGTTESYNVPTRTEIAKQIELIRKDKTWSTIESDLVLRLDKWLDKLNCPREDKEKILDDLGSYR